MDFNKGLLKLNLLLLKWAFNLFSKRSALYPFGESASNEVRLSPKESFRINYFLYILNQDISSMSTRFKQFEIYEENFGFLFDVHKIYHIDDGSLKESCMKLEGYLQHGSSKDIDGMDLFLELKMLTCIVPASMKKTQRCAEFSKDYGWPFFLSKCVGSFQDLANYTGYRCICRKSVF